MAHQMPWNYFFSAFKQRLRQTGHQNLNIQDSFYRQDGTSRQESTAILTQINKTGYLPGSQRNYNQQYSTDLNTEPAAMTTLDRHITHIGVNSNKCSRDSVTFSQISSVGCLQGPQGNYNEEPQTDLLSAVTTGERPSSSTGDVSHANTGDLAFVPITSNIGLLQRPSIDDNPHSRTDLRTKTTYSYRQDPYIGERPQMSIHDSATLSQTISNGCHQRSPSGCNQQRWTDLRSTIDTSDRHTLHNDDSLQMSRQDSAILYHTNAEVQRRNQTRDKPFKCEHCTASFSHSSSLKRHLRSHSGDYPFNCKYCSEAFIDHFSLTLHLRTHTGERPFKCKFCSNAFIYKSTLTRHLRTHTGDRPYKCQYCNAWFSRTDSLKHHLRTHTGDRPYKCEYCN